MIAPLTKNAGLKALALLLALGLWVLVAGEQDSARVFTVPLEIRLAPDRVLSGRPPVSAQVRIRGSESTLRGISAENLSIPLDLSSAAPGESTAVSIGPGDVQGLPTAAVAESVTPARIVLTVDDLVVRSVPVSPFFVGTPARGWHTAGFKVDPPEVTIEGPRSEVDRIVAIGTDPILLRDRQEGLIVSTGLSQGNPRIRIVGAGPVTVVLRIEKDENPP